MIEAERRGEGVESEPTGVFRIVAGLQRADAVGGEHHGEVMLARVARRI